MRISTALMIIVLGVVIVPSRPALAVCLNGHPSVEQEYQQSDLVFVGRVTAANEVPETKPFYEGTRYTIQVKKIFRGLPGHTLTVFSETAVAVFR